VEAEVDKTLGNIVYADANVVFNRAHVEYTFVGDASLCTGVQDLIVVLQAGGDVVGVSMAISVACFRPLRPIMRIYIQVIGKMLALP